jgi:hypothetical protein
VPEIEEREAALLSGYTWKEWATLPRFERILAVAFYEMHELIEQHRNDAEYRDMKRRQAAANGDA